MHFLTLKELSGDEILKTIKKAVEMKKNPKKYYNKLTNKTLAMIFQKTSTRTRISFESAMTQLGGHAQYLDWRTTNFTLGSLKDEVKCIARYVDVIMARVYKHEDVAAMAEASRVPVINGLCDKYHPCQAMADLMTVYEKFGKLKGIKLAYVGDGNNVCNTLIIGCAKTGMEIRVATPKGYEPLAEVVKYAQDQKNGKVILSNDYKQAVKGADVVYTDTWISMGQEADSKKRMDDFKGWTVNPEMMKLTNNAYFMHCLPAHRGYEVSDEVLDSERSIVYDQARNRLDVQKAILLMCLGVK